MSTILGVELQCGVTERWSFPAFQRKFEKEAVLCTAPPRRPVVHPWNKHGTWVQRWTSGGSGGRSGRRRTRPIRFANTRRLMSKESFDDVVRTRDQVLRLKQEDLVPMVIVGSESALSPFTYTSPTDVQTSAT